MLSEERTAADRVACRLCGAALEVRVSFKGIVAWTVDPDSSAFGEQEPELRGKTKDPRLVCSADVVHATGFKLMNGEIAIESAVEK